jgi:hypothetical protein
LPWAGLGCREELHTAIVLKRLQLRRGGDNDDRKIMVMMKSNKNKNDNNSNNKYCTLHNLILNSRIK